MPSTSTQIERDLIYGIILSEGSTFAEEVYDVLGSDSSAFEGESSRVIYESILRLYSRSAPITMTSILADMDTHNTKGIVGGAAGFASLSDSPVKSTFRHYAEIVQTASLRRKLIGLSEMLKHRAQDESEPPSDVLDWVSSQAYTLAEQRSLSTIHRIGDSAQAAAEFLIERGKRQGMVGIPSGIQSLDRLTAGWRESDVIVLAARPSVGKTALALNLALHAAKHEAKNVLFFSLEMDRESLTERMLCIDGNINTKALWDWEHRHEAENDKLARTVVDLQSLPLFVADSPNAPLLDIKSMAKRQSYKGELDMVVIDYLQLIKPPRGKDVREQEVAEISREVKALARELRVPVVLLAQLNRAVEMGTNPEPNLSHLRESGSIEQDADQVIMLWRPDRDNQQHVGCKVAKNRKGQTGKIDLYFNTETQRFSMMASNVEGEEPEQEEVPF